MESKKPLLIVPCGIETRLFLCLLPACRLLIVPCGIETKYILLPKRLLLPFNRTLWN